MSAVYTLSAIRACQFLHTFLSPCFRVLRPGLGISCHFVSTKTDKNGRLSGKSDSMTSTSTKLSPRVLGFVHDSRSTAAYLRHNSIVGDSSADQRRKFSHYRSS
jgi:hypothetical protein